MSTHLGMSFWVGHLLLRKTQEEKIPTLPAPSELNLGGKVEFLDVSIKVRLCLTFFRPIPALQSDAKQGSTTVSTMCLHLLGI